MSFESDVRKFAEKTGRGLELTISDLCKAVTKEIVMRTPVKEGRLRGNWFATIGSPSDEVTDAVDKEGNATIARAQPVIEKAPGKAWWLTNNVVYSIPIEFGHSRVKAPAGMVRVTAENVEANLRKAARENEPRP